MKRVFMSNAELLKPLKFAAEFCVCVLSFF